MTFSTADMSLNLSLDSALKSPSMSVSSTSLRFGTVLSSASKTFALVYD